MRSPNHFRKRELPALAATIMLALGVTAITHGDGSRGFGEPQLPKSPVPDGFYHKVNAFASENRTRSSLVNGVLTSYYEDKYGLEISREYCEGNKLTVVHSSGDFATGVEGRNLSLKGEAPNPERGRDVCADNILDERDEWGYAMYLDETATIIDPKIDTDEYEDMGEAAYFENIGYGFEY